MLSLLCVGPVVGACVVKWSVVSCFLRTVTKRRREQAFVCRERYEKSEG